MIHGNNKLKLNQDQKVSWLVERTFTFIFVSNFQKSVWLTLILGLLETERMNKFYEGKEIISIYERL